MAIKLFIEEKADKYFYIEKYFPLTTHKQTNIQSTDFRLLIHLYDLTTLFVQTNFTNNQAFALFFFLRFFFFTALSFD